jgi:thioredoxin reductase (NADPH)
MAKPILLSADDDSDVLRAIERDLRSQYGAEYRVIGSDSPEGTLDLLKQLKVRNDSVALLLADQRMPRMDGVEFLQEAMSIFPGAKRALLTAYADTNAAISAINQASINYFFLKPWGPLADRLYPQLGDLLDDWQASFRPTFRGIRVLGTRWSPRSYELRDFLARNHVPYQWIDVELAANDPETKRLLEALSPEANDLPVVLFPDGTKLLESVPADVAQKVGLRTRAQTSFYDLAIVGGGPAGLAAAIYGAFEGLNTVMIERGPVISRYELPHRKLSWIPDWPERCRSGAARRRASPAFRGGNSVAGSCWRAGGRPLPNRQVGGWERDFVPCADDRNWSTVATPGGFRHRPITGCRNLLWWQRYGSPVL